MIASRPSGLIVMPSPLAMSLRQPSVASFETGRNRLRHTTALNIDVESTSAAQVKLAPFLGIKIEHEPALKNTSRQTASAAHPRLFIDGQQGFKRPMNKGFIFKRRQNQRHANPVIGPQRRLFSHQPAIAQFRNKRITRKIMPAISVLLAHHVEMRLQHNTRPPLATSARRLADNQVARPINHRSQTSCQRPMQKGITQPGLRLRSARRRAQRCKMSPDGCWLKTGKHRVVHVAELQK